MKFSYLPKKLNFQTADRQTENVEENQKNGDKQKYDKRERKERTRNFKIVVQKQKNRQKHAYSIKIVLYLEKKDEVK